MKENVLKQQQSEVQIAQTFRIKFIWKKKCVIKGKKQKQPSLIARFTISFIIEERKKPQNKTMWELENVSFTSSRVLKMASNIN